MMEFDRYEGESVTLVLDDHVIQVKLIKNGKNKATLGIKAPTGAIMFRNEKLAHPIESVDLEQSAEAKTARSK